MVTYFASRTRAPTKYTIMDNPDSYVLQAINSPSHYIEISSPDDTQIDELTSLYNTSNFECNGSYYNIAVVVGDKFPPAGLPMLPLLGITVSIVALVVLSANSIQRFKGRPSDSS